MQKHPKIWGGGVRGAPPGSPVEADLVQALLAGLVHRVEPGAGVLLLPAVCGDKRQLVWTGRTGKSQWESLTPRGWARPPLNAVPPPNFHRSVSVVAHPHPSWAKREPSTLPVQPQHPPSWEGRQEEPSTLPVEAPTSPFKLGWTLKRPQHPPSTAPAPAPFQGGMSPQRSPAPSQGRQHPGVPCTPHLGWPRTSPPQGRGVGGWGWDMHSPRGPGSVGSVSGAAAVGGGRKLRAGARASGCPFPGTGPLRGTHREARVGPGSSRVLRVQGRGGEPQAWRGEGAGSWHPPGVGAGTVSCWDCCWDWYRNCSSGARGVTSARRECREGGEHPQNLPPPHPPTLTTYRDSRSNPEFLGK